MGKRVDPVIWFNKTPLQRSVKGSGSRGSRGSLVGRSDDALVRPAVRSQLPGQVLCRRDGLWAQSNSASTFSGGRPTAALSW